MERPNVISEMTLSQVGPLPPPSPFVSSGIDAVSEKFAGPLFSDITKMSSFKKTVPSNNKSVANFRNKPRIITRSDLTQSVNSSLIDSDGYRKVVSKSRRRNYATGTRKNIENSTLKSADRCVDIYIGRCDADATAETLQKYIEDDLKIIPRSCLKLDTKIPFATAFKITVNSNDKTIMLDPTSWPEGIIYRRFFTKIN